MPVFRLKTVWIPFTLFCVAMAFMESAVVVYLRELYYPGGFSFPLVILPENIALTEVARELATLVMLLTAGYLAGKNPRQRFAWFIYGFAVWDIFYYVFLKLLLNWPGSWFTWDILFLIPVVWTGPVIVPVIVSLTMILLSVTILHTEHRPGPITKRWRVWLFVATGSVLIFLSFIWDYSSYIIRHDSVYVLFHPEDASLLLQGYIPGSFNWVLFLAGEAAEVIGVVLLLKRTNS